MEFKGLTSASHMSLPEAGYGSEEGYVGSEISGAVSGVTTPGASRLQASQSQERSTTMQRLHADGHGFHGVMGDGCLHGGGGTRTTEGQLSLRRMRAALFLGCCFATDRDALAFCLLRCCCAALPCPPTPGEQTGQRPSPLLVLTLCSCHCPQSLVDRYPRSSGSSVMLWATSGSPGTHGIERARNHLSARDAR